MRDDSDTGLTPSERQDLRRLAGLMIPASEEYGVPGADDPAIFADIVKTLGRDRDAVRVALTRLTTFAGGAFTALDQARAETMLETLQAQDTADVATLGRVILQSYYRDDRVILSLGFEPRAPFPKGNVLEQGDWSLLDPVRARPKFWRDAPP